MKIQNGATIDFLWNVTFQIGGMSIAWVDFQAAQQAESGRVFHTDVMDVIKALTTFLQCLLLVLFVCVPRGIVLIFK